MDQQRPQQGYMPPQQPGYTPPPSGQSYMQPQQPGYNMSSYPQSNSEPLTMGQYIIMFLLLAIPIVNIIMLFIWGFGSDTNINKKNFAKASLVMFAVGIVLSILFSSIFGAILSAAFSY